MGYFWGGYVPNQDFMLVEESSAFQQTTDHIINAIKSRFVAAAQLYNRIFFSFAFLLGLLGVCALIASKSALAFGIFSVGMITALLIAYVTMRFCAERKEEEGEKLAKELIDECHATFDPFESEEQAHLIAAEAARTLSQELAGIESSLCHPFFKPLEQAFEKLSVTIHQGGVRALQEAALKQAASEIIEAILHSPMSSEHHKKLAIVYLEVACLYGDGSGNSSSVDAYSKAIRQAISQLGVAKHLGSKDPWLYEQLIECYSALKEREKLLAACLELLEVAPERSDALYYVGRRYFEYGLYAEGLKIYERLLPMDSERARLLLRVYHRHLTA